MPQAAEITLDQALDIRQQVLWPDLSCDYSRVLGDEQALYLGGHVTGGLVSVLPFFDQGESVQLCNFATLPEWQDRGVGTTLFLDARTRDSAQNKQNFLHARASAISV